MKHTLRLAGAALLATALATTTAFAGGHHGGGHFGGGGGGHAVAHAMPHTSFHVQGVRSVPHVGHHVTHNTPHVEWNGGHHEHHHHNHHRFVAYSSLYDYDNSYYDRGGCGWLWQRYLDTGNRHWKHRYYECIE